MLCGTNLWQYKRGEARYQVKGISERAFLLMIVNKWVSTICYGLIILLKEKYTY